MSQFRTAETSFFLVTQKLCHQTLDPLLLSALAINSIAISPGHQQIVKHSAALVFLKSNKMLWHSVMVYLCLLTLPSSTLVLKFILNQLPRFNQAWERQLEFMLYDTTSSFHCIASKLSPMHHYSSFKQNIFVVHFCIINTFVIR